LASEVALAGQLTEAQAELAAEKRARRAAEKQMSKDAEACALQLAAAAAAEAHAHAAEGRAASHLALAEAAAQEGGLAAARQARREGEVACQKLAERLARAEALLVEQQSHAEAGDGGDGSAEGGPPGHQAPPAAELYPTKEPRPDLAIHRRLQQLEKTVVAARRREFELTAANGSLEAKAERLARELRGARPAPVSRAKVADLESRAAESDRAALAAAHGAAEARAMVAELQGQVGELSVARAERDAALRDSRALHGAALLFILSIAILF
jgi:hypothetical protein